MSEKSTKLTSLGVALASLSGMTIQGTEAKAIVTNDPGSGLTQDVAAARLTPNAHVIAGEDLLGFVMTQQADGTIIADHASHASHHSHSSHASSRY